MNVCPYIANVTASITIASRSITIASPYIANVTTLPMSLHRLRIDQLTFALQNDRPSPLVGLNLVKPLLMNHEVKQN